MAPKGRDESGLDTSYPGTSSADTRCAQCALNSDNIKRLDLKIDNRFDETKNVIRLTSSLILQPLITLLERMLNIISTQHAAANTAPDIPVSNQAAGTTSATAVGPDPRPSLTSTEAMFYYLGRQELAYFRPPTVGENITGVVYTDTSGRRGRSLTFTDVECFISHLNVFLYNHPLTYDHEQEAMPLLTSLLTGPAHEWWSKEVTEEYRDTLNAFGIRALIDALRDRFSGIMHRYHKKAL
ncbi:hypothetical protein F4820DRAFT_443443 [Hypoxylon rubiginosum]|uniref:Uncharacterized protein n=1 Tax=Hypoxylon rubiginosum TaxID=110542 RepID=A0ACB9ZGL0_9PEZI|nr:hypothetical protein F4820DRAFT_443443 [Hypoxylon rubiginosum]